MPHIDISISNKYRSKAQRARDLGHFFDLPFSLFKRMRLRRTCALSGVKMTLENSTIDRIDNRKGYIEGNVAGVRTDINSLKGQIEQLISSTPDVEWKHIKKMVDNTVAHIESKEGQK